MIKNTLLLLIALLPGTLFSATKSHEEAVRKYFEAIDMKGQFESGLIAGFELSVAGQDLSRYNEEFRKKVSTAAEATKKEMIAEMGWAKGEQRFVELYTERFTEAEIRAILPKLEDPQVKAFMRKQNAMVKDAMKLGQSMAMEKMPAIMKKFQEAVGQ